MFLWCRADAITNHQQPTIILQYALPEYQLTTRSGCRCVDVIRRHEDELHTRTFNYMFTLLRSTLLLDYFMHVRCECVVLVYYDIITQEHTLCSIHASGCMGTFYGDECFCCFRQLRMRLYEAWASIGLR